MPVTYAAFGAMAVTVDGTRQALTRGRDRGVLAVLLAAHGVPVPADRLVAEVWGADAPPTALGLLQVSVSRLRGILEPDRASRTGSRLVSTGVGYAVSAGPDEVDTWAFEDAAAAVAAAGSPTEVLARVRGGGGSFGIITRIEVALHPAPHLYGGRLLWPLDRMAEVLDVFRTVTRDAPAELTLWFHTYQFPPSPELPEPIRGKSFVSVAAAYLGTGADAERLLAPFRGVGDLVMDLMGEVPMGALGSIADEPTEPMPGMQASHLVTEIDDRTAAALVAAVGPGSGSPLTIFQIRHLAPPSHVTSRTPVRTGP